MKDDTLYCYLCFFIVFILIISCFSILVGSDSVLTNDFVLYDYKEKANFGDNHTLYIENKGLDIISIGDVDYEIKGSKEDIRIFNRCVDIKVVVDGKIIKFDGEVKEWGIYSVDIVPVINDVSYDKWAWWNSSWNFKNETCITNNITDYTMEFNMTYDSDMQSDFEDIRWVGGNTTELYHWIEDRVNGSYCVYQINISTFDYIAFYYGNAGASVTSYLDGNKTFMFFDDFNDGSVDWGNRWLSNRTAHYNESGGYLEIDNCYPPTAGLLNCIYTNMTFSDGYYIRVRMRNDDAGGVYRMTLFTSGVADGGGSERIDLDRKPDDYFFCRVGTVYDRTSWSPSDNDWYNLNYIYTSSTVAVAEIRDLSGNIKESKSGNPLDGNLYIQLLGLDGSTYGEVDYVYVKDYVAVGVPTFCTWVGEVEQPSSEIIMTSENPVNLTEDVSWADLNITVLLNNTWGEMFLYANISLSNGTYTWYTNFTNFFNSTVWLNETFNLSSVTWYTWYVNVSCNNTNNNSFFKFKTFGASLDDIYNLQNYMNNKIIGVDDELDINIGLDGTFLTLVLFAIFFIIGYIINKRSGGILMIFSGFSLLSFEYLVSSASILSAILVIPLLTPISILIIILGVRKWLYPVEGEHTKSEGT